MSLRHRFPDNVFITKLSLVLFGISLVLPALHMLNRDGQTYYLYGYDLIVDGILAMFFYGLYGWLANPLYLITILCFRFRAYKTTLIIGIFMIICMLSNFQLYFRHTVYPMDEGGVNVVTFSHFTIGAYFWFASMLLPVFSAGYILNKKSR